MRYFYTDPLAAAWMQVHFGMKFLWNQEPYNLACQAPLWEMMEEAMGDGKYGPFVIHPVSLHLLEPQMGDVIDLPTAPKATRLLLIHNGEEFSDHFLAKHEGWRIIQRSGKAFHWPEREAA